MVAWAKSRYRLDSPVIGVSAVPAYAACGTFAVIMAVGVGSARIGYVGAGLDGAFMSLAVLWMAGLWAQAANLPRLGEAAKALAVFSIMSMLAALSSAVLALESRPIADEALANLDRAIFPFFDWVRVVTMMDRHAAWTMVLNCAYVSLTFQPMMAIVFFVSTDRSDHAWRMLSVWGLTLAACILLFPFWPAVGGYVHFDIPRSAVPGVEVPAAWDAAKLLYGLKGGTISSLSTDTLSGIVTMPSFHAGGAVVLGWGFWRSKRLRWPFTALNALMIVSAVPIGGHYLVDVIAGCSLATGSIALFSRQHARSHYRHESATQDVEIAALGA